jgi:putative hemolysin
MTINILILLALISISAFFSAAEVAFLSLSDAKIEAMKKKKLPKAGLLKKLKSEPRRLLITILIGNNVVNIGASSFATVVATQIFESAVIGITTGVMTLLVLVFGEIAPKSYASNHPRRFAIFSAPILRFFQIIIFPLVVIFEWITILMTGKQTDDRVSEEELRALAKTGLKQGAIEEDEGMMIERLFSFNDITVEDIMTPRVHVVYIHDNNTIEEATKIIEQNPHTRFPIIENTPDKIIGFVHSRDVLLAYHKDKENVSIKEIIHPIIAVPKQMPIDDIMREFQKTHTHMAMVVDEYGGTLGIVTFEDVIEELVGEITDEHDINENLIERIDKNTIHVSGDTIIRDIIDFLNCTIPGDEFDTIAEIMLDELQKLPRRGQTVTLGDVTCTVTEVKKRRIQKVKIQKSIDEIGI